MNMRCKKGGLKNSALKKLAGEFYPASSFSLWERYKLRKMLYREMLAYYDEHRDSTLSDIREYFQSEELSFPSGKKNGFRWKTILLWVLIAFFLLATACVIMYRIAGTWEPPAYYVNY